LSKNKERQFKLLRLVSGSTVLANVLYQRENTGQEYELTKPMEVIVMPDRSGQTMITLMDFIPASRQEVIRIGKAHVMCSAVPDDKVAALYQQATNPSAVIAPPEQKLALPPGV